jgi:hypothetical protein
MFESDDKKRFLEHLDGLVASGQIKPSTRGTYGTWVNRLDRDISINLTTVPFFPEKKIAQIAEMLPSRFNKDHKSDARCIIRHYRRYRENRLLDIEQDNIGKHRKEAPRKRVLRSIALRRGQRVFRDRLLKVFCSRCVVTGTTDKDTLEAAHIQSYGSGGGDQLENGLLLRSDVHVLFDLHLISIHPKTLTVFCHQSIRQSATYGSLHGMKVRLEFLSLLEARKKALTEHYGSCSSV